MANLQVGEFKDLQIHIWQQNDNKQSNSINQLRITYTFFYVKSRSFDVKGKLFYNENQIESKTFHSLKLFKFKFYLPMSF